VILPPEWWNMQRLGNGEIDNSYSKVCLLLIPGLFTEEHANIGIA
jgi:hypothetical protein